MYVIVVWVNKTNTWCTWFKYSWAVKYVMGKRRAPNTTLTLDDYVVKNFDKIRRATGMSISRIVSENLRELSKRIEKGDTTVKPLTVGEIGFKCKIEMIASELEAMESLDLKNQKSELQRIKRELGKIKKRSRAHIDIETAKKLEFAIKRCFELEKGYKIKAVQNDSSKVLEMISNLEYTFKEYQREDGRLLRSKKKQLGEKIEGIIATIKKELEN